MRGWRLALIAIVSAAIVWAMRTYRQPTPIYPVSPPEPPSTLLARTFDPTDCGSLSCSVRWEGDMPKSEPLVLQRPIAQIEGKREVPNSNQPRIARNSGLADCVVWLRDVDLSRSKQWNYPPVILEPTVWKLIIRQGEKACRIGIVRRGAEIQLVSHESSAFSVSARGAAFFTQMLFDVDRPVRRQLANEGVVELSSGTGNFWHRGYLVVSDHPYVGVTDENGEVRFDAVPAGEYDVLFWKANWHVATLERDPELIRHVRMDFQPSAEKSVKVKILPGQAQRAASAFSGADFRAH